jgi:hypothetical protein
MARDVNSVTKPRNPSPAWNARCLVIQRPVWSLYLLSYLGFLRNSETHHSRGDWQIHKCLKNKLRGPYSASELYRLSDSHLSAKLSTNL